MKTYKDMPEVDVKLHLIGGDGFKVENLEIHPYTLGEMKDYGYANYMINLQWLSLTVKDFIDSVLDLEKRIFLEAEKSKLKTFDFYTKLGGHEMAEGLMVALAMVFKTKDIRFLTDDVIALDFLKLGILEENEHGELVTDHEKLESMKQEDLKLIHRDNFDQVIEAVQVMNNLKKIEDTKQKDNNPANDEVRKLMEQMASNKKRIEEMKKKKKDTDEDDEIDIADIISAVTAKSNSINKFNVWDLTLYQLYDEYARIELIDSYDFSIRAMMAGAEKVQISHWSKRL